jgi:hypothetical protein
MALNSKKEISTFQAPDYSRTRIFRGSLSPLEETGFASIAELVAQVNRKLFEQGRLPITCGDYPSSEKKLARLVKRWRELQTDAMPLTNAA